MSKQNILVVDDNETNRKMVSLVLTKFGYEVDTVTGPEEALESLKKKLPALILMDVQMPGMDGYTLTKQLKKDPRTRDIVIGALTAFALNGEDEKAMAAGCDGYVAKPVSTRELPKLVADFIKAGPLPGAPVLPSR